MSGVPRQVMPHAAIGASLCLGAYSFFVEPVHKRLDEARAREEQSQAELRPADGMGQHLSTMTAALKKAEDEAGLIRDLGRPARDERDLFASITALADACRVRIDQLTPGTPGMSGTSPSVAAGAAPDPGTPATASNATHDAIASYTIAVVCSYPDLVEFLRQVRSELGYSTVHSVRLAPLPNLGARAVQAVIETEHYSFDPAPAPAQADSRTADAGGHP